MKADRVEENSKVNNQRGENILYSRVRGFIINRSTYKFL